MDVLKVNNEIYLNQIEDKDAHDLMNFIGDKDVQQGLLAVPCPYLLSDAINWIRHVQNEKEENGNKLVNWAIRNSSGKLIGGIGLHLNNIQPHRDEFGYWLAKDFWGQGIMSSVIPIFRDYVLKEFNLIRLEAPVYDDNIGSQKVLERNGFKFEGVLEKAYCKNGEYKDAKMYAFVV